MKRWQFRCGGDETTYKAELVKFVNQWPTAYENIITAVEAEDFEEVSHIAHSLKGVSGNLGLVQWMEWFAEVERSNGHKALEIVSRVNQTRKSIQQYIGDVDAIDKSQCPASTASEEFDSESVLALIDKLIDSATLHSFEESDIEQLQRSVPQIYHVLIDHITQALDDFEFQNAHDELTELKRAIVSSQE